MTIVLSYISYIYLYNKWIILLFTTERNFTSILDFVEIILVLSLDIYGS